MFFTWLIFHSFHKYSYGSINFPKKDFEPRKVAVENFIANFLQIDEEVGSKAAKSMIADSENCKSSKGTVQLGGNKFDYDYVVS